jgi:GT2 family glycosyltransferase
MDVRRPDLSISIVSLNRPDLVRQCLGSIEGSTRGVTYEVHLVANDYDAAALQEIARRQPALVVHAVSGVRGFSANNNVALRAARGRYLAILNDDTILSSDVFAALVRFLDAHPDVAAACPVLRHPDGALQVGVRGRLTPWSLLAQQLKLDRLLPAAWAMRLGAMDRPWLPADGAEAVDIEGGSGACFVARREAFERIGFLDEAFFLGPDDVDWTQRLLRHAGRVVLLPAVSLTHLGGATLGSRYWAVLPSVYAGYYTFLRRYHGQAAEWAVRVILGFAWSGLLAAGWGAVSLLAGSARARMLTRARWECVRFAFSRLSSPEVFARLLRST